jgi:type VI secretion system protein ImpJ
MKPTRKIIWSEGMFLVPQHFQQWDHYHESHLNFRVQSLRSFPWGLLAMEIDKDALANDRFALLKCSGVMPDGLTFLMPETDKLPESRNIAEFFLPSMNNLDVFLAIPVEQQNRLNVVLDGDQDAEQARYRRDFIPVLDETSAQNEKQIGVARKQFRIVFSGETLDELHVIKIGQLVRSASGQMALEENFIPACLRIAASDALKRMLRQLLEMLTAKQRSLSEQRRQQRSGAVEFGASEISSFWFLHTVNSFLPIISHYHHLLSIHPEELFMTFSQLAGELITFSPEGSPGELPAYQHEDLTRTFGLLYERLSSFLETVLPTRCVPIPLEQTEPSLFVGRILDDRLLEGAQFYLGVAADIPEAQILSNAPYQIKLGSKDKINLIVSSGMPGLALYHAPRPPSEIRIHMGFHYFRVETQGDYWELIRQAKNIAVYVPSDFVSVKLELMAIKE